MHVISINKGQAELVLEQVKPGQYRIIDNSVAEKDCHPNLHRTEIAFDNWDHTVHDVDCGRSEQARCFGVSTHLRWSDVILTPDAIHAQTLEDVEHALQHVDIVAYCQGHLLSREEQY